MAKAALVIAIDGPAAAGKGTLARRIAEHLGLPHLDTGALYRAVARRLLDAGAEPTDEAAALAAARRVTADELGDPRLRDEAVSRATSIVSALPAVRAALLDFQRSFAGRPPGAVLDGRDIGTVVCPGARVKLFVTASPEERARRRAKELRDRGVAAIDARVLQDIKERDARDSSRNAAPLAQAADAYVLDTTQLDPDAAFKAALAYIAIRDA